MTLKTPREKVAAKKAADKALKEAEDKAGVLFNAVAATEDGQALFKHLMERLGFLKNTVTMNPQTGEVNEKSSVYLEARRSVYLEMRRNILPRYLKKIEF
ncbi:MAG: hypothetical protein HOL31_02110 [Candidatus Scalindua sp.]|jgi:hypothetical protein|nr:hypothetical protein [Candidatus Scalindua sp.]MBT7349697.1 hypothetical protein [candidate division WWE3 bacterium]